ncbi:uncharacterized protein K02A2.6-like [Oryzias latipes]|uniref:uncharacterized protein K02A2.6-like n=1 Tax=Oryzias latipes TaxID=8090 RepID=UPI000CE1FE7B|nr:uncharacterized protein K02A2.6-like [Oryzias latipes]
MSGNISQPAVSAPVPRLPTGPPQVISCLYPRLAVPGLILRWILLLGFLRLKAIRHHGIPSDIVSDRGPQFTSQVWKAFCSALGATVSLTSGYHPQANGQAERANQELEAALRCLAAQNQEDWSKYLVNWIWQCPRSSSTFSGVVTSGCRPGRLSSAPRRATAR